MSSDQSKNITPEYAYAQFDYAMKVRANLDHEVWLAEQEIKRVRQKRAEYKEKLILELGRLLEQLPLEQIIPVASKMYWESSDTRDIVRKAYVLVLPKPFKPLPTKLTQVCHKCQKVDVEFIATSWEQTWSSDADKKITCSSCKLEIEHRRRKQLENKIPQQEEPLEWLKTMPYKEYLFTNHWRHKRQQRLEYDKHICQLCKSQTQLHVHHLTYERRGEELLEDLITWCKACHRKHHGLPPEEGDK